MKRGIVWFRNDLRIHDNEALYRAVRECDEVIGLFVFDPQLFEENILGERRIGSFRAKFLSENVESLKLALKSKGSDLFISLGKTEDIIQKLIQAHGISDIYFNEECGTEEKQLEEKVELLSLSKGINVHKFWSNTLFHKEDLPFPVKSTPDIFSNFRKALEKESSVREMVPSPDTIKGFQCLEETQIPSLYQLGYEEIESDSRSSFPFSGGEDKALEHLNKYVWENQLPKTYKDTRNGLIGTDYSSKFSPWLAHGSLSPRKIYFEIKKFESEVVKNRSTYWIIFELIWRDFFHIQLEKQGSKFFTLEGLKGEQRYWTEDIEKFNKWKSGNTGIPFIDANMRELNQTGFMSNRGRQNVASFLTKDLNINWLWGAAYFEQMLIDHDVSSNYGNWQYVAGLGLDPREDRYFNVMKQALFYDKNARYMKRWLPELSALTENELHRVFLNSVRNKYSKKLNYPSAIIVPKAFKSYL